MGNRRPVSGLWRAAGPALSIPETTDRPLPKSAPGRPLGPSVRGLPTQPASRVRPTSTEWSASAPPGRRRAGGGESSAVSVPTCCASPSRPKPCVGDEPDSTLPAPRPPRVAEDRAGVRPSQRRRRVRRGHEDAHLGTVKRARAVSCPQPAHIPRSMCHNQVIGRSA